MTNAEKLRQCTDEALAEQLVLFATSWHLAFNAGKCMGKDEVLKVLLRQHQEDSAHNYSPEVTHAEPEAL